MIKVKKCKICGSEKLLSIRNYKISRNLNDNWDYVLKRILNKKELAIKLALCRECGFIFYEDVFDSKELKRLYEEENRFQKSEKSNKKKGRKEEVKRIFEFFEKNLSFSEIKTVIDVGAGDFVILDKLMARYPNADYCAMDPSYTKDFYKKARVFHNLIENYKVESSYDLVLLIHVLEHVSNLNLFLKKINLLVKEGKYLYVEIPFQVGPGLFLNRSVSSQHINYFTPTSIKNVLHKFNFQVKRMEFDKDFYKYNGMPGMIRILAKKRRKGKINNGILESIYFLTSPTIFLKNKVF